MERSNMGAEDGLRTYGNAVLRLRRRDLPRAAAVCARACRETPHVRYFFPDGTRRARDATALFAMRIRYALLYGEVDVTSPGLEGVAVWIPSERASMTTWREIRAGGIRLYRAVGREAVARMTHVAEHNDRLRHQTIPGDHWFLSILGVDPSCQRQGHARRLLEPMLACLDDAGIPAYVELTDPALVRFYERFGFKMKAESTVPGTELTVWTMVRAPAA